MMSLRYLVSGTIRAKTIMGNLQTPFKMQRVGHHDDGPPQPFDNLPFSIPNRYAATVAFALFFGTGFWVPYIILWYSMAKRTL